MILKLGGDEWCRTLIYRWAGKTSECVARVEEHGAVRVYAACFGREEVVRASCDDYRAGAEEDVVAQEEDQRMGMWDLI